MMISELPKGSFFSKRGNREVFDMKMATKQKKWFYSRLRSSSLYRRGSVAECSARRTHNPAVLRSSPVLTNCCIFVGRAEFKSSPRL